MMKQRLIGAAVLVALGVIFIPMMLTGEGNFLSGDVESNVPPKPLYELEAPKVLPLNKRPSQSGEPVVEPAKMQSDAPSVPQVTPSESSESSAESTEATKKETSSEANFATGSASKDSAVAKQPELENPVTGVATAANTDKPAAKTTVTPTAKPVEVTEKPVASAAGTTPAPTESAKKPASAKNEDTQKPIVTGWAVQLGSFSVEKNAVKLRDSLRKKGHASFVEEITQNGKTSYRVRVGPELTRELANELKKTLKAETKLDGFIVAFSGK